jgi:hypothetical protein
MSGLSFLRESGYQFYIYAPKSDPLLRRRWAEPLPPETLEHLGELARTSCASGLELGVGLTPFEIYLDYDARARSVLRSKVQQINDIGVQILCILFDDMRGDIQGLAELQGRVIADICEHSNARRFIVAPTYYTDDERLARQFGPAPHGYLRDLGRAVDLGVDFFWTGEKVISDAYTAEHLARVAAQMGRKPFIWDNHMANDGQARTNQLFLDPAASSWDLASDHTAGLAINPMNQHYLSRIALCGYRQLLMGGARGPQVLRDICYCLCSPSFAEQLLADMPHLRQGLGGLDPRTRHRLLERYESEPSNPYAQEIAAWLRGEYVFDPACLTS